MGAPLLRRLLFMCAFHPLGCHELFSRFSHQQNFLMWPDSTAQGNIHSMSIYIFTYVWEISDKHPCQQTCVICGALQHAPRSFYRKRNACKCIHDWIDIRHENDDWQECAVCRYWPTWTECVFRISGNRKWSSKTVQEMYTLRRKSWWALSFATSKDDHASIAVTCSLRLYSVLERMLKT